MTAASYQKPSPKAILPREKTTGTTVTITDMSMVTDTVIMDMNTKIVIITKNIKILRCLIKAHILRNG
jgi:hypothetical protein